MDDITDEIQEYSQRLKEVRSMARLGRGASEILSYLAVECGITDKV